MQTRRGSLVQDRFPDLVAAALDQLPPGLVLDGELLVWDPEAGALSFEALQRRAAARARGAAILAAAFPAYFVAFDVLQVDGVETMTLPYRERRRRLEVLFSAHALTAPWTLCPQTTDLSTAQEWLQAWTDVSGVEGLVIKPLTSKYLPNYRGWTKVRRRDTTEAIIGAISGTLTRPQLLVLGPATTTPAAYGRWAVPSRCARSRHAWSRSAWRPPSPGTRGPGALRRVVGLPRCPGRHPGAPGCGGGDQC
ncbi:hypothetical protein OG509_00175 [Streptomyces sp. NBC_01006]|nr:hypothetical protein OG509_00175 [Streptomyces sp. NBC_01006]